ncbi:MAG TPA: LpqB family beta-propeller domain-containing protein [Candidatus Nanopelagicales bacterium]|nr:LpqB family beta-propeller domain-containing protein [Candidatus Nanopelagicales bacterium]
MTPTRLVALAATAAALLSACATIPTSGPIQQGPVVAAAAGDQIVRVLPRAPIDGMTPEEIVRGFQEATASADPEFEIARSYLTPDAAAAWKPDAGVAVYDDSGLATSTKGAVVTQDGVLSSTISSEGQYSVVAPPRRTTWTYTLVQTPDQQWRINQLPQGLVLGPGDITRSYRSFDIYFFTRDYANLVPDPVTVPASASGQATQLVRQLLAGPTPWLAPAVSTAFPQGTRLALGSVPVTDGVAEVALSREVLNADDQQRQKLSGQLVWTLRQVPDVASVRITVKGQPLPVPGVASPQPIDSWSILDPDVLQDNAVAYAVGAKGLVPLAGPSPAPLSIAPRLSTPAVSLDSTQVAGVSADGRSLYVGKLAAGTTADRRYVGRGRLSRPSWDRTGAVWVVDRGTGLVTVRGETSTDVPVVAAPKGFSDSAIQSVSVSRDGTRLAMLVLRGTLVEPWMARIERQGDGVTVSTPIRVDNQVTQALDLAWADAETLVVLGTSGATALEVVDIAVGTSRSRHSTAPDASATSVAAAPGPGRVDLVGDRTSTWQQSGSTWTRIEGLTDPVYPG